MNRIRDKELVIKTHIANIELVSWVVLGAKVIVGRRTRRRSRI